MFFVTSPPSFWAAQLLGDGPAAFLRCGSGGLGCLSRSLGRAGPCPMCGSILFLQSLFLPKAGDGVTGRKLGIFHDGLPPVEIGIGFHRCLLCLFHIPPGFQFPVRTRLMETPIAIAHSLLNLPFSQVAGLNAGVIALHLAHFTVEGGPYFLDRPGQWVAMFLAGRVYGDSSFRRVQPIRRLVRLTDGLFQFRRRLVCLGKLQTGGRAVPGCLTLPKGVSPLSPRLFRLSAFPVSHHLVRRPDQCPRRFISRRIILLRGTV